VYPVALVAFIACHPELRDHNRLIEEDDSLVNLRENRIEGTDATIVAKIVFGKSKDRDPDVIDVIRAGPVSEKLLVAHGGPDKIAFGCEKSPASVNEVADALT
jgi:hypothetical protein